MSSRLRSIDENWRDSRADNSRLRIPDSDDGWHDYQQRMWSAWMMEGYTEDEMALLQLFLAYDEGTGANGADPDTIGETVPVVGDFPLVVDTGTSIVAGGLLGLDDPHENSPDLARALRIWKRSRWQTRKTEAIGTALGMGEVTLEPQVYNREGHVVLVPHDPRSVVLEYDPSGLNIERATITISQRRVGQIVTDSTVRILTPEEIRVEHNGQTVAERSGRHDLGVTPLVHIVPFPVPGCSPMHGLSVAHPLLVAKAQVDSALAQANAIGSRQGNPILVAEGFQFGNNANNPMQMGRVIDGVPPGGKVYFLTSDPTAIKACLDRAREIRATYISAMPEFYFSSMGAGESGEARRIKAAALERKYEDIRATIYGGITEATRMAVDLEAGRRFSLEANDFTITAAPILDPDTQAVVKDTTLLHEKRLITTSDAVRQLQRVGYVAASQDPDEYAALLEDNNAEAARVFFGGRPGDDTEPEVEPTEEEDTEDEPSEALDEPETMEVP